MPNELNLQFPDRTQVIVTLNGGVSTRSLAFSSPLTEKDHADIRWYLETYGAHSLGDPDDSEARRIAHLLPVWGRALFNAVFSDPAAFKRFVNFQQMEREARLLTISAEDPLILALPWELLHDPSERGEFLFLENPRISIRRRVQGSDDGRQPFDVVTKDRAHLLFVVSRPYDAGFLDPRADSLAVLDAIEEHAPDRLTCEFLRPATLDALVERLEDKSKPSVDILHFDGHGVFDRQGGLLERVAQREGSRFPFDEVAVRQKSAHPDTASPAYTGYLLFETVAGKSDLISAAKLGSNLHRHNVALVILSACQSAAVRGDGDTAEGDGPDAEKGAMGSVAARLTSTGIPSVLAMTHSVLVYTTRALFGEFYKELVRSKGVGEALDNARRFLANHPQKYEVQRGPDRVPIELYDWFLPALYQPGADGPLLYKSEAESRERDLRSPRTNLPAISEAGFFGRSRELWNIERWFAGSTRRITITGFGGQGKTALALEAGRWLARTNMFQAVVFVDYSRVQAGDAVAVAVSNIGSVLEESLIDERAALQALKKTGTLVVLDNLEALAPKALCALLDAAVKWSEANGTRVLCTTRRPIFDHEGYRTEGTVVHRRIVLDGLGNRYAPDDALEWFATLVRLPPAPAVPTPNREEIISLFDQVRFHPLSIRVLTQQLKTRSLAEVTERLTQLLAISLSGADALTDDDTPSSLLASIQLSLDQLDAAARELLPILGVFQGGAWENVLKTITGLDKTSDSVWLALRAQLEGAALIDAESVSELAVPFLRFHPTLAPMLWAQLSSDERAHWSEVHRGEYYHLSSFLYSEDNLYPWRARALAWRELPNLLHAVYSALDASDPNAAKFASNVNFFLSKIFCLGQDAESLAAKLRASCGSAGSPESLISQSDRGEILLKSGKITEATKVFQSILEQLGEPSYERAWALFDLARCFQASGHLGEAERGYRESGTVSDQLVQTPEAKRARSLAWAALGDVLAMQGRYLEARQAYEDGIELTNEIDDFGSLARIQSQLGTLALRERGDGWFAEATKRFRAALFVFEQLPEPASAALSFHRLGILSEEAQQWDEAEMHYRKAAQIRIELNDLSGAAETYGQLACLCGKLGKLDAAEKWHQKAIDGARSTNNLLALSINLGNLADLLRSVPGRVTEARKLAEEALRLDETMDIDASQIWKTYSTLAFIADQEAALDSDSVRRSELREQGRRYRRMARDTKFDFAGTRYELKGGRLLIRSSIVAVTDSQSHLIEELLRVLEEVGSTSLVAAIRSILAGERDSDALCVDLALLESMVVLAILRGLDDPSSIADLLLDQ